MSATSRPQSGLRSFRSIERFLADVEEAAASGRGLKPGYVFVGDEAFLYECCRRGVIDRLIDPALREYAIAEFDLSESTIFEALDRAQTPSLLAPFQAVFVRSVKNLYTRGAKKEEFAALGRYFRSPNPQAVLLFVADHLHIPADSRRIDLTDKDKYERIRETLGEHCGVVELAGVDEGDAARWLVAEARSRGVDFDADGARELADAVGADMMSVSGELEKLMLYAGERKRVTLADVETMVLSAKQRSLYDLTGAISAGDKPRALLLLQGLLNASDGGADSAIGHLYMLARTFRQMLVLREKKIRDSRSAWQALWQGFRMPPFAADEVIRQARLYKSTSALERAITLIARADRELRSSPPDKHLVLEKLVLALASGSQPG